MKMHSKFSAHPNKKPSILPHQIKKVNSKKSNTTKAINQKNKSKKTPKALILPVIFGIMTVRIGKYKLIQKALIKTGYLLTIKDIIL